MPVLGHRLTSASGFVHVACSGQSVQSSGEAVLCQYWGADSLQVVALQRLRCVCLLWGHGVSSLLGAGPGQHYHHGGG